ncbi:hypothetical protein LWI29_018453 [Acer saccharum]|uniref:Uncharacterized protein n=1 Tax=Acer saccharum TaxID=4024 RepID=A0AA39VTD9_ACESA|nr:hypothetical protein LWI29_018453 [Acer saccharum]
MHRTWTHQHKIWRVGESVGGGGYTGSDGGARRRRTEAKPEHQQLIVDNVALLHLVNLLKRHEDGNGACAVYSVIRRAADAIANLAHENSIRKTCVKFANISSF